MRTTFLGLTAGADAGQCRPGLGRSDPRFEGGTAKDMVLLPKFLGILVFDQAQRGRAEAHAELKNGGELRFVGPTPENSVAGQIEIMTTAATQGVGAVMLSNNAGDQIAPVGRGGAGGRHQGRDLGQPDPFGSRAKACSWRRSISARSAW